MSTLEDKPVEAAEATPDKQSEDIKAATPEPEDPKSSGEDEVKSKLPETEAEGEAEPQEAEEIQPAPVAEEKPKSEERSPSPESKARPKGRGRLEIKVDLFDGEVLSLPDVDRKIKARDVIEQAHTKSDMEEKDFFSVFYYDDYEVAKDDQQIHLQQKIFLDPIKPVKPQMHPPGKQASPIILTYGVKFYVPDPSKLREDFSRYLYCVQLCDDIRRNRVRVDRETATRLTALMLQATLDDYDPDIHKTGYSEKFPNFQLLPTSLQPDNYEAQIIEVHKAKTGYTPAQAEAEFLTLAKDLPRYGQHLFLAKDVTGLPVTLGNSCRGIAIYEDYNSDKESRLILWKDIVKISYKTHKFRIKYHPPENANDRTRPVIYNKFYTGDAPQAKRIWKNAVEQHAFFRLTEPDPPSFIERLARRTSFRFTGNTLRQSMRSKLKRDHYDFSRRTLSMRAAPRRKFVVGKKSVEETAWVILDRPPAGNAIDLDKFERQKVVVDFRLAESAENQAQRYVLRKDNRGSYQMLDTISFDDEKERDFHLSEVDEESKAAMVTVTLNVEAPSDAAVSHAHDDHTAQPVFDSKRMPVVNLGGATRVTTASVVESDGKPITSGQHSQRYPLEEVADVNQSRGTYDWLAPADNKEETVGPAVEGSEEAKQVDLFLEREGELMKEVMTPDGDDKPSLEVEVEIDN